MGPLTLPASGIVYVDTCVLIYTVESVDPYLGILGPLWQASRAAQVELVTSELAVLETLVGPMKSEDAELITAYEEVLAGTDLRLIPINDRVLREAAEVRAHTSLRTPDAIHAATALTIGCQAFITNDVSFRSVPSLPVQTLKDAVDS